MTYILDTHTHADHITAALDMRKAVGSKVAAPAYYCLACTDVGVEEGKPFEVGGITLRPLHTPDHSSVLSPLSKT